MKRPKIYIPLVDNGSHTCKSYYTLSICTLCLTNWIREQGGIEMETASFPYPDGAANIAVHNFLKSDCDEMLFIDLDIAFKPSDVFMLFEHDVPLVFGLYCLKRPGLHWPVVALPDKPMPFSFDKNADPLCEVAATARGFMRVKREVFEALKPTTEKVRDMLTNQEECYVFYKNIGIGHSDDFAFCENYRRIGGKVLIDQRVVTKHVGTVLYPIKGTFVNADRPQHSHA